MTNDMMQLSVVTTEHKALTRASVDLETYEKIIIFGVARDLIEIDIAQATIAVSAKRLFKKESSGARIATESIILAYTSEPPTFVKIGYKTYKAKPYVPLPTRCWRCQRFDHTESTCRGEITCPRCAERHKFEDCPGTKICCANCKMQHSAAYRLCPEFLKRKEITELKTKYKITYSEAAKKLKDLKNQKLKDKLI